MSRPLLHDQRRVSRPGHHEDLHSSSLVRPLDRLVLAEIVGALLGGTVSWTYRRKREREHTLMAVFV